MRRQYILALGILVGVNALAQQFTNAADPPVINPGGVVDGASYRSNLVPGGIASVFGTNLAEGSAAGSTLPLPTSLQGATVTLGGVPAPLFYASPSQINFQVPWEISAQTQTSIVVTTPSGSSATQTVALRRAAPGIFTTNAAGSGQGVVTISATGQVATLVNPVPRGTYITIYCSGLGAVTNTPDTGAASVASPPSTALLIPVIMIGGVPTNAQFVGLTPGFVALYQVNALVPASVAPGPTIPVTLELSGITSNTVTIAVL